MSAPCPTCGHVALTLDRAPTERQREALDAIKGFMSTAHMAPTLEEIGIILNIRTVSTVHKHLAGLRDRGLIEFGGPQSRSIRLTEKGKRA
jgi:SOS-response transcriptional repressor LexA